MHYNPFSLKFSRDHAHLESEFQHAYFRASLLRIRIGLLMGILLFAVFGLLDVVMAPGKSQVLWFIRYALVIPTGSLALIFSFHKSFERWYQPVLFLAMLLSGLAIEAMIVLAPPPASYAYYAGIILVFIITHTFFRFGFLWAAGCSFIILIVYEISSFWMLNTPTHLLINNNFFVIASAALCMVAGYSSEYNARQRFFSRHLLKLEKEKVSQANANLDELVRIRTRELSAANLRLQSEMKERLATKEKQLELEKALSRSQKLESIGTLAGGIAHDFNNILAAIIGYTELIYADAHELAPGIQSHASEVLNASMRAKELTGQILTFSRQTEQPMAPMELKPVLEEALKLIRASTPTTITIKPRIVSRAWVVSDPTQIHRMIINLCTNAVQAMPDRTGILEIALEDLEPPEEEAASQVQLTVKDSGQGMEKEVMTKIFDPFFTTREVDQGTGMGLSVVHGIVKQYKGRILVESEPKKGTKFTILLPRIQKPETKKENGVMEETPEIMGRGEQILVLDDEPGLTRLMETFLTEFGYKVAAFTEVNKALDHAGTTGVKLDLVITDFSMPEMNGLKFTQKLKVLHPDLPVILCTGYSESLTQEKMGTVGITELLMKPLTRKGLKEKVTSILTRPALKTSR